MIDVSELRRLRANEFRRMEDIEAIFDALVAYPGGAGFHNATRADLIGTLSAATESLVGDNSQMPAATRATIVSVASDAKVEMPAGDGKSYGWGASVVDEAMAAFEQRLNS